MTEELLPFCECGCGEPVTKKGNRFIVGHQFRGENNPMKNPDIAKKISDIKIEFYKNQDNRDNASKRTTEYYENQRNRDRQSKALKQYYIDNPEACEDIRLRTIEQFANQSTRDEQSKRMKEIYLNPTEEVLSAQNNMRGGEDIVKHHHIYDHNDLSKYTTEMTRSQHTSLHRNMQTLGLEIPHINTGYETADELKLMEYIKKVESEPKGL